MEVLVDKPVENADDVKKPGIMTGDIVCFDPRTVVTPSGYIKSRFLNDKLITAILLGYARYLKEENVAPSRTIYPHYGSDAALDAGIDAGHGLIGPGVYVFHGYERSHKDGVKNTFELLKAYLG